MKNVRLLISLNTLVLFLFIFTLNTNAQNCWSALDSVVSGGLYSRPDEVSASINYNGNLVVSGVFGTVNTVSVWNGTSWAPLGNAESALFSGYVGWLTIYNGNLYAAGKFDSAGGVAAHNIAMWNGTSWNALGGSVGQTSSSSYVNGMAVFNGALYVGGEFDTVSGIPVNNIAKWDGANWSDVAGGVSGINAPMSRALVQVSCLYAYDNILYVSGVFDSAGNNPALNIASWNDTAWSNLGSGINVVRSLGGEGVVALIAYNNEIYAGGYNIDTAGGLPVNNIARWNGSAWSAVLGGVNNDVYTLFVHNGNLIVGGNFNFANGDTAWNIAQWNGSVWSEFGGGIYGDISIASIDTFDGGLYVGGVFAKIGNLVVNGIADYNCPTGVGITEILNTAQVNIYPNPTGGLLNISTDDLQDRSTIQIYNLLGQRISQYDLSFNKTEINLTGHAAGTYLYRISSTNGDNITSGSFVIQ